MMTPMKTNTTELLGEHFEIITNQVHRYGFEAIFVIDGVKNANAKDVVVILENHNHPNKAFSFSPLSSRKREIIGRWEYRKD